MKAKTSYYFKLSFPLVAILALLLSQKANAAGLGVASDYNVFTLGDFNQQSTDIEGKLAAGGNITFTNNSIGTRLAANSGNVVVAGNNLSLSNGQVNNGNAVYGGSASISSEGFPNGKLIKGKPIDFIAAGEELRSLSKNLAAITANGKTKVESWGGINLTGSDSQYNIFNLDGAALSKANNFQISSNAGSTVVVNISGTTVSLQNFGFNINGTDKQNILYNFYEATSLTASGIGIQGSILAPNAKFQFNNGHINGNVVVASLTGNGESHNYLFKGNMPPTTQNKKKVPEPGNLLGLGLIVGILGVSRRHAKKPGFYPKVSEQANLNEETGFLAHR